MADLPTLSEVEIAHIACVLRATGNNKTKAAKILGVDRRTLYRKVLGDNALRCEFAVPGRPVTRAQIEARIEALKEQLAAGVE